MVDQRGRHPHAVGLAARDQTAALRQRVVNQGVAAFNDAHVGNRPRHGLPLVGLVHRQRRRALGQQGHEVVRHGLIHDDAFGGRAVLPGIGVGAEHRRARGGVQVGVVQHHERRLAA
ncbi:hypothetical protein D3C72_1996020 [compost metagenome]